MAVDANVLFVLFWHNGEDTNTDIPEEPLNSNSSWLLRFTGGGAQVQRGGLRGLKIGLSIVYSGSTVITTRLYLVKDGEPLSDTFRIK